MKRVLIMVLALILALGIFTGCSSKGETNSGSEKTTYKNISQEEALKIMEEEEGYIILDVRTKEEFDGGHIPDAINVPVETIGDKEPEELPDKDQLILVYCRSGNRSKTASSALAKLGYTNVLEFGGINTWPGEVVTD